MEGKKNPPGISSIFLVPVKALPKSALLRLTIVAAAIHDSRGRLLNGGIDSVATFRRGVVGG